MARVLAVLVSAALVLPLLGHEDLQLRISGLDQRIAAAPAADLYARRADLHRRHRDWAQALRDYRSAERLELPDRELQIGRAQVYLDMGNPQSALRVLCPPGDEGADRPAGIRMLQARALALLGETDKADIVFSAAIGRFERPLPEHYLEHARTLTAAEPPRTMEAVAVLERGCERLGAVISLQGEAYRLEREAGDLAGALRRARKIMSCPGGWSADWGLAEGELLVLLGHPGQARDAYARVLAKIGSLSPRRRSTPAARAATVQARAAIARLQLPAEEG